MSVLERISSSYKNNRVLFIAIAVLVILPVAVFALTNAEDIKGDAKPGSSIAQREQDANGLNGSDVTETSKDSNETGLSGAKSGQDGKTGANRPIYSGELQGLFPKSIDGYELQNETPGKMDASRTYVPSAQTGAKAAMLIIMLTQMNTDDAATAWVVKDMKSYYPVGFRNVTLQGKTAYFGTDGKELAALCFQKNGVAIKIEMLSAGGSPVSLYDSLVKVSATLP